MHYNILLIEDHPANILAATALLDIFGYTYLVAEGGIEGIEHLQSHRFDVILMDIQMPLIDGIETSRRIRALELQKALPHTPIIAMTAYIASSDMNKWEAAGIEDIIPKPYHPDYLEKVLRRYCKPSTKHASN